MFSPFLILGILYIGMYLEHYSMKAFFFVIFLKILSFFDFNALVLVHKKASSIF